jgi:putative membrane protein
VAFVVALAGVLALSLLSGGEAAQVYTARTVGTAALFLASGVAGAAAMVVPGISGSFLLLLIGTYASIISAINSLDWFVLGATAVGVLVGLGLITQVIAWLFQRAPGVTYAAILGLVAGSLVRLWPGLPAGVEWVWGVAALLVGAALAFALGGGKDRGDQQNSHH